MVLCAASPYFKALLVGPLSQSERNEITIETVGGATLSALIAFGYTGRICIDDANVDELLGAAVMLHCHSVERICADYLMATLDVTNCLGLWQLGVQYELGQLKERALELALNDFGDVSAMPEFYNLKVTTGAR